MLNVKKHAKLSPSSRHRWARCPASVRLSEGIPNESNPSSRDGTATHDFLAKAMLIEASSCTPYVGKWITAVEKDVFELDSERADRLNVVLNYLGKFPNVEGIHSELPVDTKAILGRDDIYGTCDLVILHEGGTLLEIIDYKDGMSPVFAYKNEQMELYALGALATFKDSEIVLKIEKVRMTIIQPKISVLGATPVTSWLVPREELMSRSNIEKIQAEAAATDDPNSEPTPGDEQCKYCPAFLKCPAIRKEIAEIEAPPTPAKTLEYLRDEDIVNILTKAKRVEKFIEQVEEVALGRMMTGEKIPGLKLVSGRGSRKWNTDDETMTKRLTRLGIPKSVIFKSSIITPNQASALKWEKKGVPQELTEKQKKTLSIEYTSYNEGKPKVVPSSSKEEELVIEKVAFPNLLEEAPPLVEAPTLPDWI